MNLARSKGDVNENALQDDVRIIIDKYADMPLKEMNLAGVMQEWLAAARKNSLIMPEGITVLARGIMTMQETLALIDPNINFTAMIRGHAFSSVKHGLLFELICALLRIDPAAAENLRKEDLRARTLRMLEELFR